MNRLFATTVLYGLLWITPLVFASSSTEATEQRCQGDKLLQRLTEAISAPELDGAQDRIYQYGTDQRYYLMVRGWLKEVLAGVESQLQASHESEQIALLGSRAEALRSVLRRIDLE